MKPRTLLVLALALLGTVVVVLQADDQEQDLQRGSRSPVGAVQGPDSPAGTVLPETVGPGTSGVDRIEPLEAPAPQPGSLWIHAPLDHGDLPAVVLTFFGDEGDEHRIDLARHGGQPWELPPGRWRVGADTDVVARPSTFHLDAGGAQTLLVSRRRSCSVIVQTPGGRPLADTQVVVTEPDVARWTVSAGSWSRVAGLTSRVLRADAEGVVPLDLEGLGPVWVAAPSALGLDSATLESVQDGDTVVLRPTVPERLSSVKVLDALTGAAVEGALLNDRTGVVSEPTDSSGRALFWPPRTGSSITAGAPGYAPRSIRPGDYHVEGEVAVSLYPIAMLDWELSAPPGPDDSTGKAIVRFSLHEPPFARSPLLLPRWSAPPGDVTGQFVVPEGLSVRLDVVAGGRVASTVVTMTRSHQRVTLPWPTDGSEFLLRALSPRRPASGLQILYRDEPALLVPLRDGEASVPRIEAVRSLGIVHGNGHLQVSRRDSEGTPAPRAVVEIGLPRLVRQVLRILDQSGTDASRETRIRFEVDSLVAQDASTNSADWEPVYYQPTLPRHPDRSGDYHLHLPRGSFVYSVFERVPGAENRADAHWTDTLLTRGVLEVTDGQTPHVIRVDPRRRVDVTASWQDGRPVAEFALEYSSSPGVTRRRGHAGEFSDLLPRSVEHVIITAEGAAPTQVTLQGTRGRARASAVLTPADFEGELVVMGLPDAVDELDLELWRRTDGGGLMNHRTHTLHRRADGRFEFPASLVLHQQLLVRGVARLDEQEYASARIPLPTLRTSALVFEPTD